MIPLFVFLQSCGFQPLYKAESLSGFIIEQPKEITKSHTLIYKELDRIFIKNNDKSNFIVSFEIDEQYEDIDVREDEKVLRRNIVIAAKFNIKEESSNKIIEIHTSQFNS